MNTEALEDLEQRAAKHAALSDPGRLRIVDLLAQSDRSSTELQAALGVSSNLLAHRLRVLEDQGMIIRSRSQGDRRRSYVHLVNDAVPRIASSRPGHAQRLVFVCTANSARSQLAAALWQQSSTIPATSAGTHPAIAIDSGAVQAAKRHHLPFPVSTPRSIDEVLHIEDLVITVCDSAHEEMQRSGAIHWSVPDPVLVGSEAAFDAAYEEIAHRITELAPRLIAA